MPGINWTLLAAVIAAVLGFGSSTALGSAYGIAVTGTMLITTFLTFFVVRYAWHHNWLLCVFATAFFFVIDAMFFSANLLNIVEGGWFPLVTGAVVFTIMATWGRGLGNDGGRSTRARRQDAAQTLPDIAARTLAGACGRHRDFPDAASGGGAACARQRAATR
ncbi:Low affinity potassium transport system protein kup [Paraburkholderia kirstenboschensis]|nr:Low affinity potassium transport system protein kup [Paraburkholderia kirstenboschensis]